MKNKRNIKILVPVVAVIWGLVLYKLFDAFYPEDQSMTTSVQAKFEIPKYQERDTFSLVPIKQDPFLGTLVRTDNPSTGNRQKRSIAVQWPPTSYDGFVTDDNGKTTVFVITVNGAQHVLKKGDLVEDLQLLRGSKKSILLGYKGQQKTLVLK